MVPLAWKVVSPRVSNHRLMQLYLCTETTIVYGRKRTGGVSKQEVNKRVDEI